MAMITNFITRPVSNSGCLPTSDNLAGSGPSGFDQGDNLARSTVAGFFWIDVAPAIQPGLASPEIQVEIISPGSVAGANGDDTPVTA